MSITTDSASNNLTFIRNLCSYCEQNDMDIPPAMEMHIRCFLHILNLGAKQFLANIKCVASEDVWMDEMEHPLPLSDSIVQKVYILCQPLISIIEITFNNYLLTIILY